MKLTKFEHACFILEDQGKKVVVDPGMFTNFESVTSGIVAVIVTHEHADHFSPENLDKIKATNPDVQVFGAEEVAVKYPGAIVPETGKVHEAGPFTLKLTLDMHAIIHPDYPVIHNLCVNINDTVYYPGDGYMLPDFTPKIVMIPLNAPWAKVSEAMDFYEAVAAERFIPTHDGLLSPAGHGTYDSWLQKVSETTGRAYYRLETGEYIEI